MSLATVEVLAAAATFAAVTCFTPGPNNAMLMASGLNFGLRRTLPHLLGVALGFAFMVLAVGVGAGQIFALVPGLHTILRVAAVAYLLWLAWGIATAGGVPEGGAGSRPMSFLEAAAFQWVNPKAWIMALGATTTYSLAGSALASSAILALLFMLIGLPSSGSWVLFGAGLRRLLQRPRLIAAVNVALALLLVASLYPVVVEIAATITR